MIAPELVLVSPMSSWTGYVTYLEYVAGSDKGGVRRGDLFNGVYGLGKMTNDRMNYTGERVVETVPAKAQFMTLAWTPVVGSVRVIKADGTELVEGKDFWVEDADKASALLFDKRLNPFHAADDMAHQSAIIADPDATEEEAAQARDIKLENYQPYPTATADGWRGGYGTNAKNKQEAKKAIILSEVPDLADGLRVAYIYDNTVIPQDDLPILSVHLNSLQLRARARRIAIYFSQIAAFQAQTDYGFNLGDQLAEQAVGELAYEIDSEVVAGLCDAAPMSADLIWNRQGRIGLSITEQYASFAEVIEIAKAKIYKATQKFSPNFMIVSADIMPVLSFAPSFQAAPASDVAGPYFAGTLNGLKVFVSPIMEDGTFVIGVNGSDMKTSAAVYAPYMPIVPTQLLTFADGGESQGFSTLYDFQILSKLPVGFAEDSFRMEKDEQGRDKVVVEIGAGRKADEDRPFSPLLIKGRVVGSRF